MNAPLPSDLLGIWVAFVLTLFIFSSLWRDNLLSRLAEHLLVGTAAGYAGAVILRQVLIPRVVQPLLDNPAQNWHLLVPILLAVLWVVPGRGLAIGRWAGTLGLALLFGVGAGLVVGGSWLGTLWPQAQEIIRLYDSIGGILLVILTMSVPVYLYMRGYGQRLRSAQRSGFWGWTDTVLRLWGALGKITLLVGLGVIFGRASMARLSLLIDRLQFLLATLSASQLSDALSAFWEALGGGG